MLLVHFGWVGGPFVWPFGAVSAAGGFFLLSGVTLGRVGRRRAAAGRSREFALRLWRRALWLWVVNTALVLALRQLEGSRVLPGGFLAGYWDGAPRWLQILSFDQPSVLHVLPRYVVFLLLAPLVLAALRAGCGIWVGALSVLLWLANRMPYGSLLLAPFETAEASFPLASWQLLFVAGILVGHRRWGEDDAGHLPRAVVAIAVPLTLAFAVHRQLAVPGLLESAPEWLYLWFGRNYLGPLRLLNLLALAITLWWVVDRWLVPVRRLCGPFLEPFGRQALVAYLLHVPLVWTLACLPQSARGAFAVPLAAIAALALVGWLARLLPVQRLLRPV